MNLPRYRFWRKDISFMEDRIRLAINSFGKKEVSIQVEDGFQWIDVNLKDGVLQQYTQLYDKNNNEICHKDVLFINEKGCYGGKYLAEVEFIQWDDKNVVDGNKGEHWAFYGVVCAKVKPIEWPKGQNSIFTIGFLTRRYGSCITLNEMTKNPER